MTGDGSTGTMIVEHPDVDKIAFTGSTDIGRADRRRPPARAKRLSLELGGKSPLIVFEDADLDAAIEGAVDAIWFNQGQVCCAGSRLIVQEGIAERFYAKLRRRMTNLRVGDPLDKAIDMGAIVALSQLESIRELVDIGKAEGATCYQADQPLPSVGLFFPPTLMTNVEPASTLAQVEIFGPVLVAMTFRTPEEAVALANNTRYGLAASLWTQDIDRALDVASRLKAGVCWINAANMFDAAAGFGGYRESGFGREGGREGMYEYLAAPGEKGRPEIEAAAVSLSALPSAAEAHAPGLPGIDRTAKLYIGGKQARPDSGYSYTVLGASGEPLGRAGLGNRKDIRNAVEAAAKAGGWVSATAHNRAQVLYYLAENLESRAPEFEARLIALGAASAEAASAEVATAIRRCFYYAAQADKYDGAVHAAGSRRVTLAMNEPYGIMGLVCPDEAPLLGFLSLVLPTISMGNRVIVVPSPASALAATDLYQVLDTSDVPGGVVNIVTGERDPLAKTLAEHDEVAALWYFGSKAGSAAVEKSSIGNLKATWVNNGKARRWLDERDGQGREFLRRCTQVKNIWAPYGE